MCVRCRLFSVFWNEEEEEKKTKTEETQQSKPKKTPTLSLSLSLHFFIIDFRDVCVSWDQSESLVLFEHDCVTIFFVSRKKKKNKTLKP